MKKAFAAGVLGILGALAMGSASADTLYFAYLGFHDDRLDIDRPGGTLKGSFTADDVNGDGTYSKDELVSLNFEALSLGNYCYSESPISACMRDFSYSPETGLNVDASYSVSVEFSYRDIDVKTGESYSYIYHGREDSYYKMYSWTPETRFVVSTSPVPEPATFAMLGIGLGTLMLARRRRR